MSNHVVAIVAFLICYVVGFQIALAGTGNHDVFGWALLFGIAFAVPSLFFVGSSFLLFILIRWWATALLSVGAIAVYVYAPHSESWSMALAVIIATIVHQTILLTLRQGQRRRAT